MPYRYVLKYRKGEKQQVSVEAWPKYTQPNLIKEKKRPAFTIGSVKGSRTIMLWHHVSESRKRYDVTESYGFHRIHFPSDSEAVNEAYRIGLAAAVVGSALDAERADKALSYVMNVTSEEVWFWTSKFLGVVGEKVDGSNVLKSLCSISGAI